jgi:hypothetical protein
MVGACAGTAHLPDPRVSRARPEPARLIASPRSGARPPVPKALPPAREDPSKQRAQSSNFEPAAAHAIPELAADPAVTAYLAALDARAAALRAIDPDFPALADTSTARQVAAVRGEVEELRLHGWHVRGVPRHFVVAALHVRGVTLLHDCYVDGAFYRADADGRKEEPTSPGWSKAAAVLVAEPGGIRLDRVLPGDFSCERAR